MEDKLKEQKNVLVITRRYLKEVRQWLCYKNVNDADRENGNLIMLTREKNWMLTRGDQEIIYD